MPGDTIEVSVRNDINEVARASEILAGFWADHRLPSEPEMDASLALEEILSNVIRHGCEPGRDYDIRVRISLGQGRYELEISDNATPYNPLLRPDPNLDLPIEQRTPGGLGVFLVKQLADDLRYEFENGRNILTFRKNLPA
jgi:anti-sigma regulatory factor (Ser/Thr protein kinase)